MSKKLKPHLPFDYKITLILGGILINYVLAFWLVKANAEVQKRKVFEVINGLGF